MKTKFLLLLSVFLLQMTNAQNYQTIEDLNDSCSQLSFSSDEDAQIAIDNILDVLGLYRNFSIQECPNINNALAKNIEISPGHKERYILYDPEFFKKMDENANSKWASISIIAHEIGHHLNGHALNDVGSNHKWELEADYFSGISLGKMGASLQEAQSAINTLHSEKASRTHPAKADRLVQIELGWNKSKGTAIKDITEDHKMVIIDEDSKKEAATNYEKGIHAFSKFNFKEAILFFNAAKDYGSPDAYYYLSNCYTFGLGVNEDKEEAFKLAKKGYDLGSIPATIKLGMLSDGINNSQISKASGDRLYKKNFQMKWFKNQFNTYKIPYDAYITGYMYLKGYGGVRRSISNSIPWFNMEIDLLRESAKGGDSYAQCELGDKYKNGTIVVDLDTSKAFFWYQKSAEQNYARGQYNLANMYLHGDGVKRNIKKSYSWHKKAARLGYLPSQKYLKRQMKKW